MVMFSVAEKGGRTLQEFKTQREAYKLVKALNKKCGSKIYEARIILPLPELE